MTGRKEIFALNARNHGSAMAGICNESFMSNTMEPDRWPLSSGKEIGCFGFEVGQDFLDSRT